MKFTRIQAIVTALLLLAACGNEHSFQTDPSITEMDGNTISSFHFNAEEWGLEAADRQSIPLLHLRNKGSPSPARLPEKPSGGESFSKSEPLQTNVGHRHSLRPVHDTLAV